MCSALLTISGKTASSRDFKDDSGTTHREKKRGKGPETKRPENILQYIPKFKTLQVRPFTQELTSKVLWPAACYLHHIDNYQLEVSTSADKPHKQVSCITQITEHMKALIV
jgi:hypothetical protein